MRVLCNDYFRGHQLFKNCSSLQNCSKLRDGETDSIERAALGMPGTERMSSDLLLSALTKTTCFQRKQVSKESNANHKVVLKYPETKYRQQKAGCNTTQEVFTLYLLTAKTDIFLSSQCLMLAQQTGIKIASVN